jgi:hypothetical protein
MGLIAFSRATISAVAFLRLVNVHGAWKGFSSDLVSLKSCGSQTGSSSSC